MIILNSTDERAKLIKDDIQVSFFKDNNTFSGLISFEDFGDKLFLDNTKSHTIANECYVMNALSKSEDTSKNKRALKINADIPKIVYIDLDFKHEKQLKSFNDDLEKVNMTKDELMKKFMLDKNIWISGNSKSGIGIRLFFIVINTWAIQNNFTDYSVVHKSNSKIIIDYLRDNYGLIFRNKLDEDYIDRAPISNIVLKTYHGFSNDYCNVNLDCNVFLSDTKLKEQEIIYDKNISSLNIEDINYIDKSMFTHFKDHILAIAKKCDTNSRKLFYENYKRYYEGTGLDLSSFQSFNNFLNNSSYTYSIDLNKHNNDLLDMVESLNSIEDVDEDIDTPTMPDFIYENIPDTLKEMLKEIKGIRSKDIFLTSEICVLSSILDTLSFTYWGDTTYLNLNTFISGDAAGGKGIAKHASSTLTTYQNELDNEYEEKFNIWKDDANENKNFYKPIKKYFAVSANISSAQLYSILEHNNGSALMFETEAAVLASSFKQEWGDYKNILLKSFQNEVLTSQRKTEVIVIKKPKLGVILTGTKKVLFDIIPSSEDGFFSRFLFYIFNEKTKYENPIKNRPNMTNIFSTKFADKVYNIYKFFQKTNCEITFDDKISDYLTDYFQSNEDRLRTIHSGDIDSIIKRFSLMLYRIISIFTALRFYEDNSDNLFDIDFTFNKNIEASFLDAEICLKMIDVYIKHAELIMTNLNVVENKILVVNKSEILYDFILSIKGDIKKSEIKIKCDEYNINIKTGERMLNKLIKDKKIRKVKNGLYVKV